MHSAFKNIRYKGSICFSVAIFIYKAYLLVRYQLVPDEYSIVKKYKSTFNRKLDTQNPSSLNEKIQWYKTKGKNPLMVKCSDKYAVREYVGKTIGEEYLVPLIFHTQEPAEITKDKFPDHPFIIKANHTAGTNHIVRNKSKVNWHKIRVDCRWWLSLNYALFEKEWQYAQIEPRIVVEQLLLDKEGKIPFDYKLHFFNGEFGFTQVDIDRFGDRRRNLYDENWNLLPFNWSKLDKEGCVLWPNGKEVSRPRNLKQLIQLGKKLAAPFPYVRVDFYLLEDRIYFGELTFHHGGGFEHFMPNSWDEYYGKLVPLVKMSRNDI
ncbi:ATP-grasp fold amidoligase family protein [Lewinella sp. LCG006]|uniref:ATP-grasp fold amidoligase family protein n=1 Tax=Lewinella sp. LCG006 TaxID=3231911 RepID=UPI0034610E8C